MIRAAMCHQDGLEFSVASMQLQLAAMVHELALVYAEKSQKNDCVVKFRQKQRRDYTEVIARGQRLEQQPRMSDKNTLRMPETYYAENLKNKQTLLYGTDSNDDSDEEPQPSGEEYRNEVMTHIQLKTDFLDRLDFLARGHGETFKPEFSNAEIQFSHSLCCFQLAVR